MCGDERMVDCRICGEAGCEPAFSKQGCEILACPTCEGRFWIPADSFSPESIYDDGYFSDPDAGAGYDAYDSLESSLRSNFAARLARLPAPAEGDRLLDLGAAYGYAVDEAGRRGWSACGVEVTHAVARRAAKAIPGRIVAANGLSLPFRDGCFAAVTLWDVIEHLSDPHAAVAEIARVLRPGGLVVLTTGDVRSLVARLSGPRWHLYTLPEHLFFHSRESLRRLLESHGFAVESMRSEGSTYTLGYVVERLRKSLFGLDGGSFGETRLGHVGIPINLFDIVTVVARRDGRAGELGARENG